MTAVLTRYAIFQGRVRDGQDRAFRQAVLNEVVPHWRSLPGVLGVRVTFVDDRDEGAPVYPAILAIDYPDRATLTRALASPERDACREALEGRVLPRFFDGHLHHHVTETYSVGDSSSGH